MSNETPPDLEQIFQLIYLSSATHDLSDGTLKNLLRESQSRNASSGISGLLLYSEGNFIQIIEGSHAAVIGVFINPGRLPEQPEPNPKNWGDNTTLRRDEYNPPNDNYARVIVDELMPALKAEYNISDDPDLHGIMGSSSGGCAAFAVAWFRPHDFRKVITFVGSYTDIRGEYVYPGLVAVSEKKPIRIFMQDGRNDNRAFKDDVHEPNKDWFLQNVRLKDALEARGYEVNYAWGIGNHGQKQGGAIFPGMMRWLWRDQPVSTDPRDTVERSFRTPHSGSK